MNRMISLSALLICGALAHASPVIIRYNGSQPVKERWNWAIQQGIGVHAENGFWVAYDFERLMNQNEFIGCYYGDGIRRQTFQEVIEGRAITMLPHSSGEDRKIRKAVAVLVRYDSDGKVIREVQVSNLNMHVELNNVPVIWLGNVQPMQSIDWLTELYRKTTDENVKYDLISAIGVHHIREIIPVLKPLLSERSTRLRGQAAFWLGNLEDPESLQILKAFLPAENSDSVLDEAMAGMNETESPEVTRALYDWAQNGKNTRLRKKAIFWLGQKAVRNVEEQIKNIAYTDKDTEIQKQAVAALAEMDHNLGIPQLIEIAKSHPNPEVRKMAIIFLGEADDSRAHQALLDIVRQQQP